VTRAQIHKLNSRDYFPALLDFYILNRNKFFTRLRIIDLDILKLRIFIVVLYQEWHRVKAQLNEEFLC